MTYDSLVGFRKLLGQKVTVARYMTKDELDEAGWERENRVIILGFSSGHHIYASQDDEMNGPGVMMIDN